jgi:hypothetical protein
MELGGAVSSGLPAGWILGYTLVCVFLFMVEYIHRVGLYLD